MNNAFIRWGSKPRNRSRFVSTTRGSVLVLAYIIALLFMVGPLVHAEENTQKAEISHKLLILTGTKTQELQQVKEENAKLKKQVSAPEPVRMARIIREYFADDFITALAVFIGESGLRPTAMGWNCHYDGKSKACKKEDRHLAWSVDCGLTQLNIAGQTCPEWTFNPRKNLEAAREKFNRRSWQPWVAHWSGGYKGNMDRAIAYANEIAY